MTGLPLEGVTVLDLSRQLPGPVSTQILADFGADVIKIEDTGAGDNFRSVEPRRKGVSARHAQINRNKRGLAIDLKSPQGHAVFMKLCEQADVVFEQFRPGVVKRLGIDYEAVRQVNPRIVYCALSGFGQNGPLRDVVAHDPNYLSVSGVLGLLGRRGGAPAMSGPQISDLAAAHLATIGILMALRRAEHTGEGDYIDISLFDSAMSMAVTAVATYLGGGKAPSRGEERHNGRYPWSDIYETSDGQYITISAIESHFYANLCNALERPQWLPDQYADDARLQAIRDEILHIMHRHHLPECKGNFIEEWHQARARAPAHRSVHGTYSTPPTHTHAHALAHARAQSERHTRTTYASALIRASDRFALGPI